MMTQQLGFSILTAPLAAIDRRALSQAWYSALHVAQGERPAAAAVPRQPVCETTGAGARVSGGPVHSRTSLAPAAQRGIESQRERGLRAGEERRAPRSALARRIERSFLEPARHRGRSTFTLDGSNVRVHVALQAAGGGLRLVAVCPPRVRRAVAQALEQARYALAARGIALDVSVHGESA